nr:ribonuclease H-like domain-containing protein [Tanacetum cinerariifolium]
MVTHAKARISKPLARMNCHATTTSPIPRSHLHALREPNWHKAMVDEYNSLISNGMWVLVPRPANVNIVRSMLLFKHKFNADGSPSRYKARLVANGCMTHDWPIHQLDLKNACLYGQLSEIVYLHQPSGFVDSAHPNYVCHLQRSLGVWRLRLVLRRLGRTRMSRRWRRGSWGRQLVIVRMSSLGCMGVVRR